jgi:hypothetical protein
MQLLGCALAFALLAGGGGSDAVAGYAELAAQARDAQDEASSLGADTPCTADSNCSALVFTGPCFDWYAPLSLASPDVDRARALAAQQRQLMTAAMRAPDFIAPPCVPPPYYTPVPACVEAQCTLR